MVVAPGWMLDNVDGAERVDTHTCADVSPDARVVDPSGLESASFSSDCSTRW